MTERRRRRKAQRITRRRFLRSSAGSAACLVVSGSAVAAKRKPRGRDGKAPPSERLNIAGVGLGARGLGNLEKCHGTNIVALCDVDWTLAATAFESYPKAAKYRDFRKMLDKQPDLDAVVISTPDHTHAVIAAEAMKRGKHVYVETPLAHDVWEVRQLALLARKTGVTTQMGNERHSSPGIRRAVEMIWGGGLGPIREVHGWTNRPQWPQGVDRPQATSKPPAGLDWNLWLGPARVRPYHPAYHPYRWRGWLDFGTGALGAMGCHLLDAAFWGLRLSEAKTFTVEAESTGVNGETYPEASTLRYRFGARGNLPPVVLTWYDGGRRPPTPKGLPYGRELGSNGSLFVGAEHSMLFGPTAFGTNPGQVGPRPIPEYAAIDAKRPFEKIPRVKEGDWKKGDRHIQEWIAACKAGKQPSANFAESAPLTEMVLLGNVALRSGEPIEWDSRRMRVTNVDAANRFIRTDSRRGWHL